MGSCCAPGGHRTHYRPMPYRGVPMRGCHPINKHGGYGFRGRRCR
jgi:hypothetical protein